MKCFLLGIRMEEELRTHYAKGALFENFVVTEMMKSFYHKGILQQLYFWRDKTGNEIDLLIDVGGKMYPIAIKSSQTFQSGFFKNLSFFNQISGNDPTLASLIYAGDLNQTREKGQIRSWDHLPEDY